MHILKKVIQLLAITAFILVIWTLHSSHVSSLGRPNGTISYIPNKETQAGVKYGDSMNSTISQNMSNSAPETHGSRFTRTIVTACLDTKEIAWMHEELLSIDLSIYIANDLTAYLHPPKNKGHEVMTYLTYIIDHYANLPDIVIFMHGHRWTRHNNEALDYDAAKMIKRLNSSYVVKQGYVNMRCDWSPGCPEWLHPSNKQETLMKQEEAVLAKCWNELFPLDPLPPFLAQACCAQFSVSKERILSIPLSRFLFYRDWMLATPLSDYISGRIWEYSWQFVFTGQHFYCPAQHLCYCDGFGICFGEE